MTQPKMIKASLGFKKSSAGDVLARANAVYDGVYTAKDEYPNPPVDRATLKVQIDALSAAMTAALDGGKKAIAERKHRKDVVVKSLRQLGHHIEENCKDDMATFLKAGFQSITTTRTPSAPLSESIRKLVPAKNSGQMHVKFNSPAGRAQLSIALGTGRSIRNTGELDRAAGRPCETCGIGNRVDSRHGLRFSGPCRNRRRLQRLECVRDTDLHLDSRCRVGIRRYPDSLSYTSDMKLISIKVSEKAYSEFKEYALRRGRAVAEVIREAMDFYLDQRTPVV